MPGRKQVEQRRRNEKCERETRACVCTHCRQRPERSIRCLRQLIGQGRLGRALRTPSSPWSQPWPRAQSPGSALDSRPTPRGSVCSAPAAPWAWKWSYRREWPSRQPGAGSRGPGRRQHRSGQSSKLPGFFPTPTPAPGEGLGPAGSGGSGDR